MEQISLSNYARKLLTQKVQRDLDYYLFTFLGNDDGIVEWSTYSHWTGWSDSELRVELREASIVNADIAVDTYRKLGYGCAVINNIVDLEVYLLIGGHGVVEISVAQNVMPELLKPSPSVQVGKQGFSHPNLLSKNAFNKAPTKKQRMRIIKRDDFKCRICGRRPTDYSDIELHVHHIKPWVNKGVTDDLNLITLCSTCHKGIDPHYDPALFELFDPDNDGDRNDNRIKQYFEGVKRFREYAAKAYLNKHN